MLKEIDTIIWDWNGTLLNDVEICIEGINRLLKRRGLEMLQKDRYREIFTFPVRDYYTAAGFDFSREAFEIPAEEFIVEYKKLLPQASLFEDVGRTLEHFRESGIQQYIVSAMEQQALLESVHSHGIAHFFENVCGIADNLAFSKVHRGLELIREKQIIPEKALLIGDTLHDHEVGMELGVKVALVSRGHQNDQRLRINGNITFSDLKSLLSAMESRL
jgi:phosphoglycolate phosphatase